MVYLTKHWIPTTVVVKKSRIVPPKVFEINPITHGIGCVNRYQRSDKPDRVPPRSVKLLDQVRERIRYLHYSLQTEKAYVYWAKTFVLWAARIHDGFRHPREMGQTEVEGFLSMLATEKQVAPATHRQALSALFLVSAGAGHGVALDATDMGRFRPFTSLVLPVIVTNACLAAGGLRAEQIPARVSTLVQHQATQPVANRFA